jgi:hypothetical protein
LIIVTPQAKSTLVPGMQDHRSRCLATAGGAPV